MLLAVAVAAGLAGDAAAQCADELLATCGVLQQGGMFPGALLSGAVKDAALEQGRACWAACDGALAALLRGGLLATGGDGGDRIVAHQMVQRCARQMFDRAMAGGGGDGGAAHPTYGVWGAVLPALRAQMAAGAKFGGWDLGRAVLPSARRVVALCWCGGEPEAPRGILRFCGERLATLAVVSELADRSARLARIGLRQ